MVLGIHWGFWNTSQRIRGTTAQRNEITMVEEGRVRSLGNEVSLLHFIEIQANVIIPEFMMLEMYTFLQIYSGDFQMLGKVGVGLMQGFHLEKQEYI